MRTFELTHYRCVTNSCAKAGAKQLFPQQGGRGFAFSSATLGPTLLFADQLGGEQGNGQLVMAGDRIATTCSTGGRTANHIGERAVGLNEIEVGGGDVVEWMSEIANQRHTLQKNFGK